MQNYTQPPPGYQRPGSTNSFAGQPAPPPLPPRYEAVHGYHSSSSQTPPPSSQHASQRWSYQPSQQQGGYNPGVYGAMPGAYQAQQAAPNQAPDWHSQQNQDVPPPPPPKPQSISPAIQAQQQRYEALQQSSGIDSHAQGGYPQQQQGGGYQAPQQPYSNAAPPPPSQTPGGSYFPPPSQPPPPDGRPGSVYGAPPDGSISYSTPSPAVAQHAPNSVLSPNEQQPAYIPPSLSGQGVQSYMPANTNPMPGVYVPPPPDVPAWQQAPHAPLQGGHKKFTYAKPSDPNPYAQGHPPVQGNYDQQGQYGQGQYGQQGQMHQPPPAQYDQYGQYQQQQQWYSQSANYSQQQPQQPFSQPPPQPHQWQPTPPPEQEYGQQQPQSQAPPYGQPQQQNWQPGHQNPNSYSQQYPPAQGQDIEAPKPLNGRTGNPPPGFVDNQSPQSQPVSPLQHRQSMSFAFANDPSNAGRTSSVSSIALGAIQAQRAANRTNSPKPPLPPPAKAPTPPPPRDDKSKFSALGMGGPSDWEHFGAGADEVDDEEIFGANKDKKQNAIALPDSAELPAQHPSPPSTQGEWPTPLTQPAPPNPGRGRYQPTPPSKSSGTPPQHPAMHPQQHFIMTDGVVSPPSSGLGSTRPEPSQAPPVQQSFVLDDGGWGAAQQGPPAGAQGSRESQPSPSHVADLKAKDDAYEQLRNDTTRHEADLDAEIEQLRKDMARLTSDVENAKSHAAGEKSVLSEQIEAMKATAEQARMNADVLDKEKNCTIERLKEDGEGKADVIREKEGIIEQLKHDVKSKEDAIEEKDSAIAEKNRQLSDLRSELEAEKSKVQPKPTPADLVPDLDPWYAGSLDRYIGMLRSEAMEPQVEDKIKAFKAFLKAESAVRGLEYFDAPPPAPAALEPAQPLVEQSARSRGASNASCKKPELNVHVPQASPDDGHQYSPGGRPILATRPVIKSDQSVPTQQSFSRNSSDPSAPSTTILTPTSSQEEVFNKTPTPVQSPPEEASKPQYKAYVPPSSTPSESTQPAHRQTISYSNLPPIAPLTSMSKAKHDEIFFGAAASKPEESGQARGRSATVMSTMSDVSVPAPLSFTPQPLSTSKSPASRKDPIDKLKALLPTQITEPQPNPRIEDIRDRAARIAPDFDYIQELTASWEKRAALLRKENDAARRKRQEDSEAEADELFRANEISYADIGALEDEFKEKERCSKAQEDRDQYKSYMESVFDTVYNRLQGDIKSLMDLYVEAENLLHTSMSGVKALSGASSSSDIPTTKDALDLLKSLHEAIELRHEKVLSAVAERDKRYKKTEIQPLYAAGDIKKMKAVEKHFDVAERRALARAAHDAATRLGSLVRLAEDVVVASVGVEQNEIDRIIGAVRELAPSGDNAKVLDQARETLRGLKASSKSLLSAFSALEFALSNAVIGADIAGAKADAADAGRVQELERELKEGEVKIKGELERKIGVLGQDEEEIEMLVKEKRRDGGEGVLSEEEQRQKRLKMALEEAKRRNGDL